MTEPTLAPAEPVWDDGWRHWTVRTTQNFTVIVQPIAFNDRIVLYTNRNGQLNPLGQCGGWCYPKGGRALIFAAAFDPETAKAPTGWFRDVNAEGYDYDQPGAPKRYFPQEHR